MQSIAFQQGSTLIEVLITVIILAVGLLGLAALQSNSIRYNHDGYLRSIAVAQANVMADRMRANPEGISSGLYDTITATGSDPGCSSSCSATQIAQKDIFDWNTANTALLPAGRGLVSTNNSIRTITVLWDARRTGATGTNCGSNPAVDLTCFRTSVRY